MRLSRGAMLRRYRALQHAVLYERGRLYMPAVEREKPLGMS